MKSVSGKKLILIMAALLAFDQAVKIYIKSHWALGHEVAVFGDWFLLKFIENPGAAFGMELGGSYGKLILSLFRIVAVVLIGWYMTKLIRRKAPAGVVVGFALILAGALGNIIDSAFYGMLFSDSTPLKAARFLPDGGGYAGFLHGRVVDMLYFPLIKDAAGHTVFFSPIFNIADSYISIGVVYLILFQFRYFK